MFWGAEQLEKIFGGKDPRKEPRLRYIGAGVLTLGAIAVLVLGQPTNEDRWQAIAAEKEAQLEARAVQIEPAELLHTMHDHQISLVLLDVRSEADFNLFHVADARNVAPDELLEVVPDLHLEPTNTVFVVMSNDETAATDAWKILVAESLPNVYILEGGINQWIDTYAGDDQRLRPIDVAGDDVLRYEFVAALGAAYQASDPDPHEFEQEFESKIKLEIKRGPMGGGCG
jgi:rhodanese-related sulfurtransferase